MNWFFIKLEKLQLGPIKVPFWRKNIWVNFKPYVTTTLCKKWERFWVSTFHKTWKTTFWDNLGHFCLENPQKRFFPKQSFKSILFKDFILVPLQTKKEKNYTVRFFIKLEKPHFWPILGPLLHYNPRTRFFPKNPALSFFKINDT